MIMLRSPFSQLLATLTLCISVSTTQAANVTFEDDRGVTHTWDNDNKARICVRASTGGLSLVQMGMTSEQLVCYWGLWGVRGSDFDPENPEAGSIFPEVDPTPEEAAAFENGVNLSPSCWKNPRGCFRWDRSNATDLVNMVESGEVDFILHIDNGNDYSFQTLERQYGIRTIFVDTYFEKNDRCRAETFQIIDGSQCYGRSMMDIAQRLEELAIFLGVDVDVPALQASKQDACDAAASFTATMEELHARDMRIKVSIFGTAEYPEGSGVDVPYARDFDPITLWVPRTLEELGAPLLHGSEGDIVVDRFFVDCDDGLVNETCHDNTYHPVDFWLIDSRSYLLVEDWVNFDLFPDPAIMAGQFSYYPRNDGAISYRTIANFLNMYNERLSSAVKVSRTDPGTCTAVDPKSYEIINYRNGGLGLNDFICYDYDLIQEEYLTCGGYQGPFVCDICPEQIIVNPDNMVSFFGFEMTCGGAATYITNTAPVLGLTAETLCPLVLPSIPQFSCCGAPETDNSDATRAPQNDTGEPSETDNGDGTRAPQNDTGEASETDNGDGTRAPQNDAGEAPETGNSDATRAPDNDFCDICPEEIIVNPDNLVSLFGFDFTCEGAAAFIANSATLVGLTADTLCPLIIPQIPQFSCCGAPET